MMGQERDEDHISPENQKFIIDTTDELIGELGSRFDRALLTPSIRILGVCAPGETYTLELKILLELFRQDGAAATFLGEGKTADEIVEFAKRFVPNIICLSCTSSECILAALELVRSLKSALPDQIILAGGSAAIDYASDLLAAGCFELSSTREQARRTVRRYALQRARSRMGAAARVFPGFTLKLESSDQDTDANEALEAAPLTTKEGRL
jgi:methylmalonyl-CoA mutase cobalamin-binding subunit